MGGFPARVSCAGARCVCIAASVRSVEVPKITKSVCFSHDCRKIAGTGFLHVFRWGLVMGGVHRGWGGVRCNRAASVLSTKLDGYEEAKGVCAGLLWSRICPANELLYCRLRHSRLQPVILGEPTPPLMFIFWA